MDEHGKSWERPGDLPGENGGVGVNRAVHVGFGRCVDGECGGGAAEGRHTRSVFWSFGAAGVWKCSFS